MNLREHNKKILSSLKETITKNDLSNPLIVSSNEKYLNKLKYDKSIFYIGQETNGWCESFNIDDLENTYYNFLSNNNYNREFWKFLKIIKNSNSLVNVLWSNALICGKNNEIGTPKTSDKLKEVSLENLKFLYNLIKPDMTVIVSGPNNPYYEIIKEFLKYVNSPLTGLYPKLNDMLLSDEENNIHYTYHPNYLNRRAKLLELGIKLNNYYKK